MHFVSQPFLYFTNLFAAVAVRYVLFKLAKFITHYYYSPAYHLRGGPESLVKSALC